MVSHIRRRVPRRILVAGLAYATMAAAGLFWMHGRAPQASWIETIWPEVTRGSQIGLSLGGGLLLAMATIALSRVLVRRTAWAQRLHLGFRDMLGNLSSAEIAFFAISAGIAEEILFRGGMLNAWGFWPSVLIFGLAHVAPDRRFLPWTASALAAGLAFGALYAATGELVGVVVAHILINYENLHFVRSYDPSRRVPRTPSAPGLVGDRLRVGGHS